MWLICSIGFRGIMLLRVCHLSPIAPHEVTYLCPSIQKHEKGIDTSLVFRLCPVPFGDHMSCRHTNWLPPPKTLEDNARPSHPSIACKYGSTGLTHRLTNLVSKGRTMTA